MEDIKFVASYLFDDGSDGRPEWVIEFYAKDYEQAQKKIVAMKETLRLDGMLGGEITADDDEA